MFFWDEALTEDICALRSAATGATRHRNPKIRRELPVFGFKTWRVLERFLRHFTGGLGGFLIG